MASALRRIIIIVTSHDGEFLHIHPLDPNPIGEIILGYVPEYHYFGCKFENEKKSIKSGEPYDLKKLSIKLGGGGGGGATEKTQGRLNKLIIRF